MSLTVTFTGNSSSLSTDIFPPIDLTEGEWSAGLIDFQSFNSIPNLDESNNRFYFGERVFLNFRKGDHTLAEIRKQNPQYAHYSLEFFNPILPEPVVLKEGQKIYPFEDDIEIEYYGFDYITIPVGSYEIVEIEELLKNKLKPHGVELSLKVNKNTMHSELVCNRSIDFRPNDSLATLLGFQHKTLVEKEKHISRSVVKISRVNVIKFECSIINNSYSNGKLAHTIHEFFPNVAPGYKIIEVPKNIIYLPVFVKSLTHINIKLVDQDNNLVNFRGELITLRIHIKKKN